VVTSSLLINKPWRVRRDGASDGCSVGLGLIHHQPCTFASTTVHFTTHLTTSTNQPTSHDIRRAPELDYLTPIKQPAFRHSCESHSWPSTSAACLGFQPTNSNHANNANSLPFQITTPPGLLTISLTLHLTTAFTLDNPR
jgi:hypothetical protein